MRKNDNAALTALRKVLGSSSIREQWAPNLVQQTDWQRRFLRSSGGTERAGRHWFEHLAADQHLLCAILIVDSDRLHSTGSRILLGCISALSALGHVGMSLKLNLSRSKMPSRVL